MAYDLLGASVGLIRSRDVPPVQREHCEMSRRCVTASAEDGAGWLAFFTSAKHNRSGTYATAPALYPPKKPRSAVRKVAGSSPLGRGVKATRPRPYGEAGVSLVS